MTLTKIASTGVEDSLRWVLGANGTSDYTFTGPGLTGTVNDPTIYLTRGHTYIFQNNSGGHPFYIKTSIANGGTNDAYNTGVTNNGGGNGTEIVFTVPHDSPDILYYQCSSHASMAGQFNIAGSVADGSISTAKLADDAVNNDKLANSVVATIAANTAKTSNATHTGDVTGSTSLTIADSAVTTAKIANNAINSDKIATNAVNTTEIADTAVTLAKLEHGTSSNDGKFLRANNGADPTFESLPASGVTVSNNADNRVITGDGTNLNAESQLTYNGTRLEVKTGDLAVTGAEGGDAQLRLTADEGDDGADYWRLESKASNNNFNLATYASGAWVDKVTVNSSGNVGIARTSPDARLHIDTNHYVVTNSGIATTGIHLDGNFGNAGEYGGGISFGCGGDGSAAIAARQASASQHRVGLSFFTHDSTTSSANAVEKVRLHDSGQVSFNNGICLGNGLTLADANTLHDYEEGSWTPALNSGTVSTSNAKYIRVGGLCYINASFTNASDTTSGTAILITAASLPFSKSSFADNLILGTCPHRYFSYSTKDTLFHWMMNGSGIHLQSSNDAIGDKAFSSVNHSHIDASYSDFSISGWYVV